MADETGGQPQEPPQILIPTDHGHPPWNMPTFFADGVSNMAPAAGTVRFYFYRTDPEIMGALPYKNQVFAQAIMPVLGFLQMATFFERSVKALTANGVLSLETVNSARQSEKLDPWPVKSALALVPNTGTSLRDLGANTVSSGTATSFGMNLDQIISAQDISAAMKAIQTGVANDWRVYAGQASLQWLNEPIRSEGAMAADDELTDAKIAKAQAETETKIVRIEGAINTTLATVIGKIDALSGQVADQRRDRNLIIGTIVLATLALGGLFWGAITYGDAIFGRGMSVRDVVETVIKEQQHSIPAPPVPRP